MAQSTERNGSRPFLPAPPTGSSPSSPAPGGGPVLDAAGRPPGTRSSEQLQTAKTGANRWGPASTVPEGQRSTAHLGPAELQQEIVFTAAAKAFITYLATPAAIAVIKAQRDESGLRRTRGTWFGRICGRRDRSSNPAGPCCEMGSYGRLSQP